MAKIVKEYSNGEITVIWKPELCIHASNCWKELPQVFDPKKRPWVNIDGATTDAIRKQVEICPSGALSSRDEVQQVSTENTTKIKVVKDGPLMIYGNIDVENIDGSIAKKEKTTAFCRCGASKNKPYCDGKHKDIDFKD